MRSTSSTPVRPSRRSKTRWSVTSFSPPLAPRNSALSTRSSRSALRSLKRPDDLAMIPHPTLPRKRGRVGWGTRRGAPPDQPEETAAGSAPCIKGRGFGLRPDRKHGLVNPWFHELRTPVAAQLRSLLISRHKINAGLSPVAGLGREAGIVGARILVNGILIIFPLACSLGDPGGVFGRRAAAKPVISRGRGLISGPQPHPTLRRLRRRV